MSSDYVAVDVSDERAPLYAVAYQESVRGLTQQASVLDNIRTRGGLLISAAGVVTALLAAPAIKDHGLTLGVWLAIACFVLSLGLALAIIWPRGSWTFAFDAVKVTQFIDAGKVENLGALHRRLAWDNEQFWSRNNRALGRMFDWFRFGCVALGAEVILWMLVLGNVSLMGVDL